MTPNDRSSAIPVAVALVCIVGIGVAAATLTTAQAIGAPDDAELVDPADIQELTGSDTSGQGGVAVPEDGETGQGASGGVRLTTCIEFLATPLGTLVYLGAFLGIVGLSYRRYNLPITVLVGWTLLPPAMLAYFLTTDCGLGGTTSPVTGAAPIGRAGEQLVPVSQVPPWLMAVVGGGLIAGAAVLLYRSTGDEETVVPDDQPEDEPELDAFAEAAGRAADRIEDHNADVDNAVYGAWVEMTDLLDVDRPETYAPGEFAEAAVEVGMAEDDVAELTQLFNEVRYGEKDAAAREDRAVAVLRTIETQYAGTAGGDDGRRAGDTDQVESEDHTEGRRTDTPYDDHDDDTDGRDDERGDDEQEEDERGNDEREDDVRDAERTDDERTDDERTDDDRTDDDHEEGER